VSHFQRIRKLSLCHDFALKSGDETVTYTNFLSRPTSLLASEIILRYIKIYRVILMQNATHARTRTHTHIYIYIYIYIYSRCTKQSSYLPLTENQRTVYYRDALICIKIMLGKQADFRYQTLRSVFIQRN
jgi:hypothetical protein